jgi:hypothetical protein
MTKIHDSTKTTQTAATGTRKAPSQTVPQNGKPTRSGFDGVERRVAIRRGPLPEVTEVNDDAVWAEFDALTGSQAKVAPKTPLPDALNAAPWVNTVRSDDI